MMQEQLREYYSFLKQEVTKNDSGGSDWERMTTKIQSNRTVSEIVAELQKGKIEVLANMPETVGNVHPESLPHIDVTYLERGRTDGVRAWAAYLYAQLINSKFRHIDEKDHEDLMEALVQAGRCQVVPGGDGLHVALTDP